MFGCLGEAVFCVTFIVGMIILTLLYSTMELNEMLWYLGFAFIFSFVLIFCGEIGCSESTFVNMMIYMMVLFLVIFAGSLTCKFIDPVIGGSLVALLVSLYCSMKMSTGAD